MVSNPLGLSQYSCIQIINTQRKLECEGDSMFILDFFYRVSPFHCMFESIIIHIIFRSIYTRNNKTFNNYLYND